MACHWLGGRLFRGLAIGFPIGPSPTSQGSSFGLPTLHPKSNIPATSYHITKRGLSVRDEIT